ncbi:CDP-glycerol glycerophosphotransferase family protein [Thermosipho globiformans]|uniref:CDP-glycerol glycerophosphotransferase family protein n=1 Tax=Thermosipho globiformans TaxID=380685 RepID=UPI000F8E9BC8|nr:CDP-glycerol glycerophosphotransferase family protein [Thermosipho globiformans]
MSVLLTKFIDDEILYNNFSRLDEKVFFYDIFEKSILKKAMILSKHLLSSYFSGNMINILQGATRFFLTKKIFKTAINIYINHGWGTKKSPGIKYVFDKKIFSRYRILRKYTDYIICYSDFDSTYFLRHKLLDDLPLPKFLPLGHPRNDFLVKNKNNNQIKMIIKKKLNIPLNDNIILFAPTHRESKVFNNDYDEKLMEKFIEELKILDSKISYEKGITLLFRPHYYCSVNNLLFKNIRVVSLDKFRDPRPLMIASDILITDYSSIFVDYLLLQKPIVFYQPDLEYYQEIRGLVIDPNNKIHMPGPKIKSLTDILDLKEHDFKEYDLERSKKFFHKYSDDKSTERLINFILSLAKN